MTNKTFILDYEIHFKDGHRDIQKKMKIHDCMSDLHAKIRLESFLRAQHPTFEKLIVFSCEEEPAINKFFDMFGSNNPFKR